MQIRHETARTLYAMSTLKAPLATTLCVLLGDGGLSTTRAKLERLQENGLAEKKAYGKDRVMFMLSLAGRAALDEYLANNPVPTLEAYETSTEKAKRTVKRGYVPKPYNPLAAQPRISSANMTERYSPAKDNAYYRNDGNKHIKSRGTPC